MTVYPSVPQWLSACGWRRPRVASDSGQRHHRTWIVCNMSVTRKKKGSAHVIVGGSTLQRTRTEKTATTPPRTPPRRATPTATTTGVAMRLPPRSSKHGTQSLGVPLINTGGCQGEGVSHNWACLRSIIILPTVDQNLCDSPLETLWCFTGYDFTERGITQAITQTLLLKNTFLQIPIALRKRVSHKLSHMLSLLRFSHLRRKNKNINFNVPFLGLPRFPMDLLGAC